MIRPRLGSRYRILRTLGEGGTGCVVRAFDRIEGREVAVKVFLSDPSSREGISERGGGASRLARSEFRLLASHAHPNLVRVLDFGLDGDGRPYYSMEVLEGPDLVEFAKRLAESPGAYAVDPRIAEALRQLFDALDALHRRGILHLDLKPGNIIVTGPGALEEAGRPILVKLIDFGLACAEGEARGRLSGTAEYLAPERIRGEAPTARSDLYSLGAVLFEVFAGEPPFRGATAGETVRAHLEDPVPGAERIPERYRRIVLRLLEKDPARRPESVWEARVELFGEPSSPLEAWPPFEVAFVGREVLLRRLRRALEHPRRPGAPACVLLEGPRGAGKTRILRELQGELELEGREAIAVSSASAGARPGGALAKIAGALAVLREDAPDLAREAREVIEELESWIEGGPEALDPVVRESLEGRFLERFERLLLAAAARRPLALLLDDLERWDPLSRRGIVALVRAAEVTGGDGLSAVLARAEGEAEEEDGGREIERAARGFAAFEKLEVGPLDEAAIEAYLRQVFGRGAYPPELPGTLAAHTGGNALFLAEYLKLLAHSGRIRRVGSRWEIAAEAALEIPESVEAALERRLGRLSPEAREVLSWAALLERSVRAEDLEALAGGGGDSRAARGIAPGIAELLQAGFLRPEGAGHAVASVALRTLVSGALEPRDRASRHGRIARWLLEGPEAGQAPEELARHLFFSEDPGRAKPFLRRASDRARRTGDLRGTCLHLARALELATDPAERFDLLLARQDALGLLGRNAEREKDLAALSEIAGALGDPARLREAALARALHLESLGRKREALERIEEALAQLGDAAGAEERSSRAKLLTRAGMLRVFLEDFEGGFRALAEASEIAREREDRRLEAECAQIAGLAHYRKAEYEEALASLGRALFLYGEAGERHRAGAIESNLGLIHLDRGELAAAAERFRSSLKVFREIGLRRGEAVNLLNLGLVDLEAGRYESALRSIAASLEIRKALGDRRGEGADLGNLGAAWIRAGQPERAAAALERAIEIARELDNPQSESANECRLGEVELARGRPEAALARIERGLELARRTGLPAQEVTGLVCLARALLALERPEGALDAAERALELARARDLRHRLPGILALGAAAARASGRSEDAERRSAEAAGLAAKFAGPLADLPEVWFERYRVLEARRAPESADALRASYRALREQADSFEDAELREAFLRNAPRHREIDRLHEELQARTRREAAARERSFYEIARSIGSIVEIDPLLDRLLDLAIETTHAEKGLIALANSDGTLTIRAARGMARESVTDATDICRSVITDVARGGAPVLATDAGSDVRFRDRRSIIDFRIRTLMCVPMVVREEIAGAVYVDGRGAASFGPEDLDYLVSFAQLAAIAVENARLLDRLRAENLNLRREVEARSGFEGLVGKSPPMLRLFRMLEKVAPTPASILISGETGTGKEVVARAIHRTSDRKSGPFVALDCGAVPENLLESELFGHRRGAFSGAVHDRVGLFEAAHGGTLFLDEITNMSLELQAKLLRALQEGEIRRLGENETRRVNVRVIAASNVDVREAIARGRFREDLFYRLNVVGIEIPPLRAREEDIPLLAHHFLSRSSQKLGKRIEGFTEDALRLLVNLPWPGNVRELENLIDRAVILADRDRLDAGFLASLLPASEREAAGASSPWPAGDRAVLAGSAEAAGAREDGAGEPAAAASPRLPSLEEFDREQLARERAYLERLVREARGNLAEAARRAGVRNRNTLVSRLKKHGIRRPRES